MKNLFKKLFGLTMALIIIFTSASFGISAAEDYWGYTDYDNDINPNAPEDIKSYSTTVTRKSTASTWDYVSEYLFRCTTDAGTLYYTLQETKWGTFNLGMMYLVDGNGTKHQFVEGYTDWEYVYRVNTAAGNCVWSGGNHGNEILVSLELYNGETGEQISLSSGQSATANVIHIIQKTKLLRMEDLDGNSVVTEIDGWTEDDVYAELTRKYTITGPQIKLNVDYTYVKDATHYQSYTCMFPVTKTYGLYCDMFDKDGNFLKTVITPETNSNYSGSHNSGNSATRALIYGKDYSQYQFDVRVNTYIDSLDNQTNNYKTAFWDMSSSNKLYFTKYPLGETTAPVIASGTQFHTECVWLFRYDPQGRTPTEGEAPVTMNKSYEISVTNEPISDDTYNVHYGADLTDGVAATTFDAANNSWFAIWPYHNTDGNRVGSVTIDLGQDYVLSSVVLSLANQTGFGVTAPEKIEAFVKPDGGEFTSAGTFAINTDGDAVYTTALSLDAKARYLRINITVASNSPCAYINEISGYGVKAENSPQDNLARGLDYTISVTNEPVTDSTYGTSYCADLTDGIAADTFSASDDSWFIFSAYKNATNGIGTVTIDFGKYCDISSFRLHLANMKTSMGVPAPARITAYALQNGEYVSVGNFTLNTSDDVIYWTELETDSIVTSSVKFEFVLNGSFAYVNEIEVHGNEIQILKGDVNNDGALNVTDYFQLKNLIFGRTSSDSLEVPETLETRADLNGDGKYSATDYLLLRRAILGYITLS